MFSIILCCAALFAVSNARSGGAPPQACDNLMPGNPPHGVVEQTTPNPWMIDISDFEFNDTLNMSTYTPGGTYNVTLRAVQDGVTLRGFFIQGRTVFQNTMTGSFADPAAADPTTRLSDCVTPSVGVTHSNTARMDLNGPFTFMWTAPAEGTGPVWLRYTIVQTFQVWWANDATAAIQEAGNIQVLPTNPPPTNSPPTTDGAPQLQGIGFYTLLMVAIAAALKTVL